RDCAGGAAGIARDLRPGLTERVHRRPGQTAANERHLVQMLGRLRQQTLRESKIAAAVARRREVGRSPRPFLQIPCIDVARRAGQEEEDAILCRVVKVYARRGGRALENSWTEYVGKVRGDQAGAGDLHEPAPRESAPQRKSAGL